MLNDHSFIPELASPPLLRIHFERTYKKKLVSRTIDAILELSKHRVAIRKRTERKNGLEYTERRLIIPTDVEIPGETGGSSEHKQPPETADVLG